MIAIKLKAIVRPPHTWTLKSRDHEYARSECDRCGTIRITRRSDGDFPVMRYRLGSGRVTQALPVCDVIEIEGMR